MKLILKFQILQNKLVKKIQNAINKMQMSNDAK